MSAGQVAFSVVVPTRDRPEQLERTLEALDRQTKRGFEVIVVDDSARVDPELDRRAREGGSIRVVREEGTGVSRARNLGWRQARTEWVAFLDDDCHPEPDWAERLDRALASHPEASLVSGHVSASAPGDGDYVVVTTSPVTCERVLSGRWTRPWDIGFTLCMAVRRSTLARLGGFDERLGPGVREFPSAEDMDFNYRFLRSGGLAYTTPELRARHDQWRPPRDLGSHFRGYMAGWSGFSMKHVRLGDVLGGVWLWTLGARDAVRMLGSALRHRSRLRLRVAWCKLQGLATGTVRGALRKW